MVLDLIEKQNTENCKNFEEIEKCKYEISVDHINSFQSQSNTSQAYGDDGANEYQYFDVYKSRLEILKPRLEMTLNENFSDLPVKSLLEISNDEPAVVIGIFFKKYKKQDQILNEYREDGDDTITDGDENDMKLITDEDELFLEDKSQRIKLVGLGKKSNYIFTGECAAVHGKLLEDGSFEVMDIIYPSVEPVLTKTKPGSFKAVSSAIISDMGFGSPDEPSQLKQELLSNFLTDMVGEENEQSCGLHQAVFCGVLCKETHPTRDNLGRVNASNTVAALERADSFLASISQLTDTCVIPSSGEVSSSVLPSKPLHRLMFKKAAEGHFSSQSFPWQYKLGGLNFLHLPKLVFSKMLAYSDYENEVQVMKHLLKISHWAPICPDIIPSIPFQEGDSLVVDSIPDVIWTVGDEFSEERHEIEGHKVLLVVVPNFSTTSEFAIFSTDTNGNSTVTGVSLEIKL